MIQNDYILRIYLDRQNRRMLVGTVERVDGKPKSHIPHFTVFMDFEELGWILGIPSGRTPSRERLIDIPPPEVLSSE